MSGDGYRTKQRELILEKLMEKRDRHVTAEELAEELREAGVGRSTVYRTLDRLVEQGNVRRFRLDDGGSCYQYGDGEGCREHFHLKCTCCGRLFHTDCDYLSDLARHVLEHHSFELDRSLTILYGLCSDCRAHAEEQEKKQQ